MDNEVNVVDITLTKLCDDSAAERIFFTVNDFPVPESPNIITACTGMFLGHALSLNRIKK